ncbi:MAG TPA: DUF4157 domain-containing protein [Longimicrobium sp.]|nr:DUF4157 domain-containing protein [Longimicrobium sp.]
MHPGDPAALQAKREAGGPRDAWEREADAAERATDAAPTGLFRATPVSHGSGEATASPAVARVLRSPGEPLERNARTGMEARFGHSFAHVRVHADAEAALSARAVGALAYTVGRDVVFGPGRYAPGTREGRSLLAHELTHVLQQSPPGSSTGWKLQRKESPAEAEAARQRHLAAQLRVANLLTPNTVWDRARKPPSMVAPEHKPKDPETIFKNTAEWIRNGLSPLTVLTPVPGPAATNDKETFFDPTVVYPSTGGSPENTKTLEKGLDAKVEGNHIFLIVRPDVTDERLRSLLVHEVQHLADAHVPTAAEQAASEAEFLAAETGGASYEKRSHAQMYAVVWNKYQTEFRAHWLEKLPAPPELGSGWGPGGRFGSESEPGEELKVSRPGFKERHPTCADEASVQLKNQKQTRIARFLLGNYANMEEVFLCSALFRRKVADFELPASKNLLNSVRIEFLRRAITGPPQLSPWLKPEPRWKSVHRAALQLDPVDITYLKDATNAPSFFSHPMRAQPFWDEAKAALDKPLFDWLYDFIVVGKKDVPPPGSQGEKKAG